LAQTGAAYSAVSRYSCLWKLVTVRQKRAVLQRKMLENGAEAPPETFGRDAGAGQRPLLSEFDQRFGNAKIGAINSESHQPDPQARWPRRR